MKFNLQLILISQFLYTALCYKNPAIVHPKYATSKSESLPGRYLLEFHPDCSSSLIESLQENPDVTIRRIYTHELFQGLSIEINNLENEANVLHSILDHPDIDVVSPNRVIKSNAVTISNHQELSPADISRVLPHDIHQVDRVRKELGLTGQGIFVGIIDSGIDYRLPALGGGFGPGYRVVAGGDFIGYDDSNGDRNLSNDTDPIDICPKGASGHGTHVAGIIGGYDPQNNFEGVAPNVTFGMWRASACDGGGSVETLANSALAAYDAGVHILSNSNGFNNPWTDPAFPDYRIFQRMIERGIFVVISASNDGGNGAYSVEGYLSSSFSVASSVNRYKPNPLSIRAFGIENPIPTLPYPFINSTETTFIDGDLYIPYATDSNGKQILLNFCSAESTTADVQGKIVLIDYTTCGFNDPVALIQSLGGIGVILYDPTRDFLLDPGHSSTRLLPIATITRSSAALLDEAYRKHGQVSIEFFKPEEHIALNSLVNTISAFSSVGPTVDLGFSPNIAAVGENAFSTLPINQGSWGFMSGTSMAAPYISGTLALYLQYHGVNKTKMEVVLAKYKNYASLTSVYDSGVIESPLRQGAGLVQVYDTITQSVYVLPPEISFKDSTFEAAKTQELTITNEGTDAVTYRIYNNASTAIAPYNPGFFTYAAPSVNTVAKAEIEVSSAEISLSPGESKTVTVRVVPPTTNPSDYIIYGGYIQFNPVSSSTHKTIHVPYFGVVGNQKDLPIFAPSTVNFTFHNELTNYTYIEQDGKPPHLVHQLVANDDFIDITFVTISPTKLLLLDILDSATHQLVGSRLIDTFTGTLDPLHSVGFDGTYCVMKDSTLYRDTSFACGYVLTNGTYYLRISALKVFGDVNNTNDYQYWNSVPFTIQV